MTVKVLFICMGNICRSPTAHGVFAQLVTAAGLDSMIEVDSAGTHAYHVGEPPDGRAQRAAIVRGYDLSDLSARMVTPADCLEFDYLLVMDRDNYSHVRDLCDNGCKDKVRLFLDFADQATEREVPDPYYGGPRGFDYVLDLVESASRGLLDTIRKHHSV